MLFNSYVLLGLFLPLTLAGYYGVQWVVRRIARETEPRETERCSLTKLVAARQKPPHVGESLEERGLLGKQYFGYPRTRVAIQRTPLLGYSTLRRR
jgi:hypothetical protein